MLADSKKDMNQMLAVLKYKLNNLCLNINVKKTKTMVVDKSDTEILANIKKQFCYLGNQITNNNKSTEDVKKIIELAKQAF